MGVMDKPIISPPLKTFIFCFLDFEAIINFCNCLNEVIETLLKLVIKSPDFKPALLAGDTGITEPTIATDGKGPIEFICLPLRSSTYFANCSLVSWDINE